MAKFVTLEFYTATTPTVLTTVDKTVNVDWVYELSAANSPERGDYTSIRIQGGQYSVKGSLATVVGLLEA